MNLSPATPEMPKIIIKEISEKIRNKKPNVENILKQLVNETLEKRQNVKLEDIAFITPKLIIDRMKQFHSISDDELLLLDEHIREIIKHETDDINNEILAYKHLPTELMFNLTFQPN